MPASGKDDLPWLSRPLAIVGMACRLPGGDGLSEFWHLLSTGGYAIERMPDSKLDRGLYYNREKGVRGKTYSDIGGFVTERELDWDLMNLDPQEAANWDPCHLNLCEVAAKAVLHAGYEPSALRDSRVGVFVGHSGGTTLGGELAYGTLAEDYVAILRKVLASSSQTGGPGSEAVCSEVLEALKAKRPVRQNAKPFVDASYASALVSKVLGLRGPSISIDAACASSLVALALAANSLQSGESEAAIVGGASYNKSDSLILFSHAQSCSADGSRPFDQAANGLISSEGYVTLLVKTLEKAEEDGDAIQAVICGIGASSDGRGRSLWAPRKEGQYTAIERAYSDSVSPSSVQMIEAHATSTRVGDATEMEALAGFYAQHLSPGRRLPVGSVKSNIGHTLETAGLAGLVKAILSIQNQVIPPSVNLERPSDAIQWSDIPLYVPTQAESWGSPSDGMNRRAAVNAFGIGGLNVHVVVEEYQQRTANSVAEQLTPTVNATSRAIENCRPGAHLPKTNHSDAKQSCVGAEPVVAVIGRGLVLPEFLSVTALAEYLTRDAMSGGSAAGASGKPSDGDLIGRISGFQYDWRKHKVPPKQIAQANPLQFMLLEAAEQALTEAGIIDQKFDRQKTAVVVGSPFGGDFGNALYAGLRLPEFRAKLVDALSSRMVDRSEIERVVAEFEVEFLRNWPALTDETGSFTSSTLASRLSKTFDLMGGAMALDAGDCSGAAALSVACQLLQGGTVNQVLCAAAHSALDAAAIDNLQQLGRFPEVVGTGVQQPVVGEGVVLLLLKRKDDAERDGNRCFTTIDRIGAGFNSHSLEKAVAEAASSLHAGRMSSIRLAGALELPGIDKAVCDGLADSRAVEAQGSNSQPVSFEKSRHCKHTGYLQATQPLADLVEQSLLSDQNSGSQKQLIASHTFSGLSYLIDTAEKNPMHADSNTRQNESLPEAKTRMVEASELIEVFRFESDSLDGLKTALDGTTSSELCERSETKFSGVTYRAAVVCPRNELVAKVGKLKVALENPQLLNALSAKGIYARVPERQMASRRSPESLKTAWLFPGQGSQSRGMLQELVADDPLVALDLETANSRLAEMGQPSFQEMAWSASAELGEDIWHTQASMLIADWLLGQQLSRLGHEPSVVSGHSYGELPAMLFAGCWSLENALRATWIRCKSIVDNVPAGFSMLSVQADRSKTESLIAEFASVVEISHLNAPNQTVVGGRRAAVADFAQRLEEQGGASRILAVPTAFHTSALQPACKPFLDALQAIPVDVPETPFLSSVSNRYVADPHEIRANLAKQLTTRLDFVGLMERLVADGVRTVVEVGPGRVLSQLTQRISDKLNVITMDTDKLGEGRLGASEQVLRLTAQFELSDCVPQETPPKTMMSKQISKRRELKEPVHFDATQLRKQNRRLQSRNSGMGAKKDYSSSLGQTSHFDATDTRRKTNAARAEAHGIAGANSLTSQVSAEQNQLIEEASPPALKPAVQENLNAASGSSSQAAIEGFLIDFVVEQTGYPPEIIEIDWDMEADLGIDSIKKAQLFGELREFFDLEVHSQLSLDEFRSLRDIVNLLLRTPGKGEWAKQLNEIAPASQYAPSAVSSVASITSNEQLPVQEPEPTNSDDLVAEFTRLLVDFVVEQTGYPPEIIELDADLEADLGIDSIKKAQLLGELGEMFTLDFVSDSSEMPLAKVGDELRTLRAILDFLLKHTSVNDRVTLAAKESVGSSTGVDTVQEPSSRSPEVHRAEEYQAANPLSNDHSGGTGNLLEASGLQTERHSLEAKQLTTAQVGQEAGTNTLLKNVEVGQLPTAVFALGEYVVDEEFRSLAHSNVSSLVARKRPANGQGDGNECLPGREANRSAEVFAASLGLETSSVVALDAAVSESCYWKCDLRRNDLVQDAKSNRLWLASFHGPAWLTQERRSHPLSAVCHRENNSIEFMVAGCTVSNAKLHDQRLLVVGGFEDPQEHSDSAFRLAEVINSAASSSSEVIERAKCLRDVRDWWLIVVDVPANKIVSCANRRNVYTLQESELDSAVSTSGAGQESTCKSGLARLGLNLESQEFVLETASDYHVVEHALPKRSTQVGLESNTPAKSGEQTEQIEVSQKPGFVDGNVASRYILRMAPAPLRVASGRQPSWVGTALVVGNNPVARQLESRLRAIGVAVQRHDASEDEQLLKKQFLELTANGIVPHLFLTTPCDSDSTTVLDASAWKARRAKALLGNYWLCQEWLRHVVDAGVAHESSLVAVTTLGGEFGFGSNVRSAEGGGLAGLLKSMLIETWTQGIRPLPIKILDTDSKQSPAEVVDCIWRELATPSYDFEVSYRTGQRNVVRAIPRPLQVSKKSVQRPSGTFVCTGGARGITAYVAEQLALRYDLNLQLLGTAPVPNVDPAWHHMDADGLRELRATVMKEARGNAKNPIRAWQDTEKAIEIDANLKRFQKLGIPATYYQCDVSNRSQVVSVLEKVRAVAGPIRGVLHGAGVGKDARFDRKQPGKVEQCIAAKVDGAITLMDATQDDPLEYFVGFGSISGRFGANGHTDYSLANEMLCKQIDWFKQQRPHVKAVGFHWHAWGDVGMATKPETRLALEMIDMQFMPANEGIEHLVNELESDENETEVLITDDRYYRMFFPAETLVDKTPSSSSSSSRNGKAHPKPATSEILRTPMLQQSGEAASDDGTVYDIFVDSVKDPFLSDHLLDGKPLLPFVVAAEMLFEGASRALGQPVKEIREIQAVSALRFFEDGQKCLHLETSEVANGQAECQLFCDFHARDGRLVQAKRLHFSASGVASNSHQPGVMLQPNRNQNWETVQYPDIDAQFYVGWSLRRLRSVSLTDDGLIGRISAPALIELAGATRDLRGWIVPCAAMDACLFATGILAWQRVAPGSALPSRIGLLQVGRQPDPGEACDVHIRLNSASSGRASFDFTLYGVDGAMILNALDYEVAWIGVQSAASKQEKSQAR